MPHPTRTLSIHSPAIPQINDPSALIPMRLSGSDAMNHLFEYHLLLKTPDALNPFAGDAANVALDDLIGQEMTVMVQLDGSGTFVAGAMGQTGAASFATPAVQTMFASYVHDSKAGFLMGAEPFSYFRQRGVTESSINILARGLRWFDEVAKDVSQNVIRVYYSAEKVVVERWTQGKKDIQQTYAVGEKFIITTGKIYALEIIDSTSKMATKTFDAGEKMVLSAVNETKSLALEVEQTGERIVVYVTKHVEDGWRKMKEAF